MAIENVGIVIIGRNEGQQLIDCIKSVRMQSTRIVYVDSGSTDDSIVEAQNLGAVTVQLDMSRPFTAARARNAGLSELKRMRPELEFVQFIDGDCELAPGWIEDAYNFLVKSSGIAIVFGHTVEKYPEASVYNLLCSIEWITPIGEVQSCGGNSLIRVAAFEQAGGFQPKIAAGEEPELCSRLRSKGWRIWHLDTNMVQHDADIMRFSQWWFRTVRNGFAFAELSWLTRSQSPGIYRKEAARAVLWGGLIPSIVGVAALLYPPALIATLVYPLQVCRIASYRGLLERTSWKYAYFMVAGRFAEFQGMLRFVGARCVQDK